MEKAYFISYKSKLSNILAKKNIDRIYVGDGECDFNFIYYLNKDFYIDKIYQAEKKITVVTPCTVTQNNTEKFKLYIEKNISKINDYKVEFVINDWGIYHILKSYGFIGEYLLGPYMYYQKRDSISYYLKEENDYSENDLDILGNISINNNLYTNFLNKFNYVGVEVFNYTLLRDMKHVNLPIHLHYPNVVKSITKYCYNHMIANNYSSLNVVEDCSGCEGKEGSYEFNNRGIKGIYSANKYYYKIFSKDLLNNKILNIKRIVYNFDF